MYTYTEMAYKNGYTRAARELREDSRWAQDDNGGYICEKCKGKNIEMTKFCPHCGRIILSNI